MDWKLLSLNLELTNMDGLSLHMLYKQRTVVNTKENDSNCDTPPRNNVFFEQWL